MARKQSRVRRGVALDGMLLLDKPDGISSNRALQRAKHLLDARKAGHTGSLDPIATGLLPLCFGEATKISGLFLHADKEYWTRIQLGVATDTGDRDGRVLRQSEVRFSEAQLNAALAKFRGAYLQTPPMYSALKQNGQPLYAL
ncbi:MAG: tRNA pseudouridine(55) synthase TruB, partial [bacterium]